MLNNLLIKIVNKLIDIIIKKDSLSLTKQLKKCTNYPILLYYIDNDAIPSINTNENKTYEFNININ